jgi:hypothetical protein
MQGEVKIMNWHKIILNNEKSSRKKEKEILGLFYDYILHRGEPIIGSGLTILSDFWDYVNTTLYFSPGFSILPELKAFLEAYDAETCSLPATGDINFISGDRLFAKQFLRYEK